MSKVVLREATIADVDAIFAMAHELAVFEELEGNFVAKPEDYLEALFGPQSPATVIVAEIDGEPVGMALYVRTFSTFLGRTGIWLEDLFVREHARRRGIASLLLEELQRRTSGRVEWEVLDWNQGAIELYERAGASPFAGWIKYRIQPKG